MSLADRYTEFVYRIATTKNRLKVVMTPVGVLIWFSLSVLFIFASLWVDKALSLRLPLSPPSNIFASVPLLVIGTALCLITVSSFVRARGSPVPLNPPNKLLTTGLYSQIRNPMHLGWILMLFGLGILLKSGSLIFIFTPVFILLDVLYLKTMEEKEMEKKFGEEYLRYKKNVPMFIPRFGKRKQV